MIARLRQRLAGWLHRLAAWVWTPPPPPATVNPVLLRALQLVDAVEHKVDAGASGEYKRHLVYARLLKEFPLARRRDIALLLETAVQEILTEDST